jgi:hypothetical protein
MTTLFSFAHNAPRLLVEKVTKRLRTWFPFIDAGPARSTIGPIILRLSPRLATATGRVAQTALRAQMKPTVATREFAPLKFTRETIDFPRLSR